MTYPRLGSLLFVLVALGATIYVGLALVRTAPPAPLPSAEAPSRLHFPELERRADSLMQRAIRARAFPGAAVAVGWGDTLALLKAYGCFTYACARPVALDSRFDLASLTKVVATTAVAMRLVDAGRLSLDAPVGRYLAPYRVGAKRRVTVRHLLLHTSGLPAFAALHRQGTTPEAVREALLRQPLASPPGAQTRYSDLGFATLGLVLEAATGQPLPELAEALVFRPLGMAHTGFFTHPLPDSLVLPTEEDRTYRMRRVQGEVHDEVAAALGGAAGHAGLYSTAPDLVRFATVLVHGGRYDSTAWLRPETLRLFTTRPHPGATRALGWDLRSLAPLSAAGRRMSPAAYGHTGFTGTSLWIDPARRLYVILLTNRTYPSRDNDRHRPVRGALADMAVDAWEAAHAPAAAR